MIEAFPDDNELDLATLIANPPALPEASALEREEKRERRRKWLVDSGVLQAVTVEDAEWLVQDSLPFKTHALEQVEAWTHARGQGGIRRGFSVLAILGLKGRGKTLAGGWLIGHYGPGVYCTAQALGDAFDAKVSSPERDLFRKAQRTRVLFIDELGREKDPVRVDAALFDLLNTRRSLLPGGHRPWTLLGGNIAVADFRARYDDSTVSRIEQQGMIQVVRGEDLRKRLVDRIKSEKAQKAG